MYVLSDKEKYSTSEEARLGTMQQLLSEGFNATQTFASGIADWFVVGGRWSGELIRIHLDQKKLEKCDKEFEKKYGWFTNGKIGKEKRQEQYKKLFKKYFPTYKGECLQWRNSYNETGYIDDGMIVNDLMYEKIIKDGLDKDYYDGGKVVDMMYEEQGIETTPENTIDKKWIVVIDFHQ